MAAYITLTTARATVPDPELLLAAVKAQTGDPTAVLICRDGRSARGKKSTLWTPAHIAAAQSALDTVPAVTPQTDAQRRIDAFPIEYRALVLALVDGINVLRTHPAIGLPAVTPAQALQAIRAKAGTLNGS